MSKRVLKKIVNFFLTIVMLFFIAENYLLYQRFPLFFSHDLADYENASFDHLLVWENIPNMIQDDQGELNVSGQENVDSKKRRYIGNDVNNPSKKLLFLGCSYTFGLEISDEDTFVYKLSRTFSDWQFDNNGVSGYGTHQCRLLMEKLLSEHEPQKYDCVFYAFMNDHPHRVAYEYSYITDREDKDVGILPYADFSWNGKVNYHGLDVMFVPGADKFRSCSFINSLYSSVKSIRAQSPENRSAIFNAVLDDMLQVAKKYDVDLSVLILDDSEYSINQEIINKGLNVYDIKLAELFNPEYHVDSSLEKHPNGLANDYWAEKISEILKNKFNEKI